MADNQVSQTKGWCILLTCIGSSEFGWRESDGENNVKPVLFKTRDTARVEMLREHAEDIQRKILEFEMGHREADEIDEESDDMVAYCELSKDATRWVAFTDDIVNDPICAMDLKGEFVKV